MLTTRVLLMISFSFCEVVSAQTWCALCILQWLAHMEAQCNPASPARAAVLMLHVEGWWNDGFAPEPLHSGEERSWAQRPAAQEEAPLAPSPHRRTSWHEAQAPPPGAWASAVPKRAQIVGASDLLDVTCAPSIPHTLEFGSIACKDPFFVWPPRNLAVGVTSMARPHRTGSRFWIRWSFFCVTAWSIALPSYRRHYHTCLNGNMLFRVFENIARSVRKRRTPLTTHNNKCVCWN